MFCAALEWMVMRMACKDCIHYRRCITYQFAKSIDKEISECDEFQNKVDFVEVVRCDKCKHWIYWADEKRCSCDLHYTYTNRDYFCGYGERKEIE